MSDDPERKLFMDRLSAFNEERGVSLNSCPTISKQPLDLYRLYYAVKEKGGFSEVTKHKLWKEIASMCNIMLSSTAAYSVKKQYIKHILSFECKYDRGGIDPQTLVSQSENTSRKKSKSGVPSPASDCRDSNSQGSYPQSSTPGSLDGSYPSHGPSPMSNNYSMPQGYTLHHASLSQLSPHSPHSGVPPTQSQSQPQPQPQPLMTYF